MDNAEAKKLFNENTPKYYTDRLCDIRNQMNYPNDKNVSTILSVELSHFINALALVCQGQIPDDIPDKIMDLVIVATRHRGFLTNKGDIYKNGNKQKEKRKKSRDEIDKRCQKIREFTKNLVQNIHCEQSGKITFNEVTTYIDSCIMFTDYLTRAFVEDKASKHWSKALIQLRDAIVDDIKKSSKRV